MKPNFQISYLFFLYFILVAMIYPSSKSIALCVEIKGQVLREGHVRKGYLRQGDSIYDGDKIIINERGFLSIMFIKDKTIPFPNFVKYFDNTDTYAETSEL